MSLICYILVKSKNKNVKKRYIDKKLRKKKHLQFFLSCLSPSHEYDCSPEPTLSACATQSCCAALLMFIWACTLWCHRSSVGPRLRSWQPVLRVFSKPDLEHVRKCAVVCEPGWSLAVDISGERDTLRQREWQRTHCGGACPSHKPHPLPWWHHSGNCRMQKQCNANLACLCTWCVRTAPCPVKEVK